MPRFACLAAALLLLPAPARAYWEYGHQLVAKIAWANVRPTTRARITRLLAEQALLETPGCPAGTIEQASLWGDCIKKAGKQFRYAYPWHFQDVKLCQPFDLDAPCKDGNCLWAQIEREVAQLKARTTPEPARVQALVLLIHFVGDLHQPLHAEDDGDEGGNKIPAAWGIYAPKRFSFHQVWDGPLQERAATTGPSLVRRYSPAERARLGAGDVRSWSRESWDLAHVAYAAIQHGDACAPPPDRANFDEATTAPLIPVARLQFERAGIRMAKLLDTALAQTSDSKFAKGRMSRAMPIRFPKAR